MLAGCWMANNLLPQAGQYNPHPEVTITMKITLRPNPRSMFATTKKPGVNPAQRNWKDSSYFLL